MAQIILPPGIVLDDPRPIAADAPYTYFLPHRLELAALRPGDAVQAVFRQEQGETTYGAERMWVTVERLVEGGVSGTLANVPYDLPLIRHGDPVTLPLSHVITVKFSDDMPWPDLTGLPPQRGYWDRCFVDDCVLRGRSRVDYLYREEPDMTREGDTDPDSGWRIRGTEEAVEEDRANEARPHYVALGAVLNKDDRWLHLIDREHPCAFQWDETSGTYMELE